MRRPQVGTIAREHIAPLLARILEGLSDEMRDVSLVAACHPDVRRRGSAVLADQHMALGDSGALRAVGVVA